MAGCAVLFICSAGRYAHSFSPSTRVKHDFGNCRWDTSPLQDLWPGDTAAKQAIDIDVGIPSGASWWGFRSAAHPVLQPCGHMQDADKLSPCNLMAQVAVLGAAMPITVLDMAPNLCLPSKLLVYCW